MLDAGKLSESHVCLSAKARVDHSSRVGGPFVKGDDHRETKYGCGKRRTAIFCAVARHL